MYSKIKSLDHPMHLMLVNFPIGLLVTAAVFDIIHLITGNGYWSGLAFWMIAAGTVGGLISALTGVIDWTGIPKDTNARRERRCRWPALKFALEQGDSPAREGGTLSDQVMIR